MEFYEHPLLDYPSLMLALLKVAAHAGEASYEDCIDHLQANLKRAHEHPQITAEEMTERLKAAESYLSRAGLLAPGDGEHFHITERGRQVLDQNPMGIDDAVLLQFSEFRRFIHQAGLHLSHDDPRPGEYEEGNLAFQEGRNHTDNPYASDSIKHLAWENGWFEGRDKAKKGHRA
jgi:restriction endonuclease Mrr